MHNTLFKILNIKTRIETFEMSILLINEQDLKEAVQGCIHR
jgi:hypothetical protein